MTPAITTLDVNCLPRMQYVARDSRNLADVVLLTLSPTVIGTWTAERLLKPVQSLGFAMANPSLADRYSERDVWDNPYKFVWFVAGWGPEADRYIANAVRKLRPALRTGRDTLDLFLNAPQMFQNPVKSQEEDGSRAWGDFSYGGAIFLNYGGLCMAGAVSCFTQEEDPAPAVAALGAVGSHIHTANRKFHQGA